MMAKIIDGFCGEQLYIYKSKDCSKRLCDLSPSDLKHKIILMGKKLADDESEGEISEEDEGGGDTSRNRGSKKIRLCRELSSLFSISTSAVPSYFSSLNTRAQPKESVWNLSESATARLIHSRSEEVVNQSKSQFMKVYPNVSRVDSSNFNPQDFWNSGIQMVALNFQTPGQMMDIYEGKFKSNGACGYVIKPAVMREQISVFSANSKDNIPGVTPQLLKIKIISAQYLPKPRGSTAVKASFIDPYVVIQVFGMAADCKEARTRTVSDDENCPVFDESFDFVIHLPSLTLVRFLVLDDDFIGDDFVGQYAIPFDCIQTGYRHIRLLSCMGEPLEKATLFVHISIASKNIRKRSSSKRRKAEKLPAGLKVVGLKQADDAFKNAASAISDAEKCQQCVETAWSNLQAECNLDHTANIKQCLKVIITRFLAEPANPTLSIIMENGIPFLRSSLPNPLPSHLHKLESALEKLLLEMHNFLHECEALKSGLEKHLKPALDIYETLEQSLTEQGIRTKKANKARANFPYNVRVMRGLLDRLQELEKKCRVAMEQVESTKSTLGNLCSRDRSPSFRDRSKLNLPSLHPSTSENFSEALSRSPTSHQPASCKPKSILKKSNSNVESTSSGYIQQDSFDFQYTFEPSERSVVTLRPPLHHSLSYTPGFNTDTSSKISESSEASLHPSRLLSYESNNTPVCSSISSFDSSPSTNGHNVQTQEHSSCSHDLQANKYASDIRDDLYVSIHSGAQLTLDTIDDNYIDDIKALNISESENNSKFSLLTQTSFTDNSLCDIHDDNYDQSTAL